MGEVLRYGIKMLPAAMLGLLVYALTLSPRRKRLEAKGLESGGWREVWLAVFVMFTAGLLWLTVLPRFHWADGQLVMLPGGYGLINLKPFLIFEQSRILAKQGVKHYFLINFWGNIGMFLPIGFFPALLWRKWKWWKSFLCGFGLSMFIELAQIPIQRGTDIDDLWMNTLGAVLGYVLYWLLAKIWPATGTVCKCKEAERHG